ncbi:hypothetical protein F4604DRAFT_1883423 [Suillus subluteus]|nr:hypothetical protein F4604DRAFT_1883423 [Suillus subluteus]
MNQWRRWTDEIIPSLIAPYLTYLRKSASLCDQIELQPDEVATFQCKSSCRWRCCPCAPAPLQLLSRSYFACTPITPSLAVDLQLLELVKTLFVHITPNTTAWCETLEVFLAGHGYHLTTKDNIRRRFGNAYHWYSVLFMSADDHLSNLIGTHRPLPPSSTEGLTRPSDYLRSRCTICFGLDDWRKSRTLNLKPDVHTCIDACFTQKRSLDQRGGGPDPPNPVRSVFLSDDESCHGRPLDRGRKRKQPAATEEEGDDYEDGITQFFADTGVMAMLCRHDHVLWLANMTSAGEKQHYALALIKKLFDNLPTDMTIGLFCLKYQLLDDAVLHRITFAISVFHAYGHQWACQIIYHPRKCEGFGLSDGEGCERLWSALKHLIAPLRVSGHLDDKNLSLYGNWLIRRWNNCVKKKSTATQALRELSVDETCVRQEWKSQVEYQMKPLPRRSKTNNDEEISKILSLEKSLLEIDGAVRCMEMQLCIGNVDNLTDYKLRLVEERAHRSRITDTLSHWKTRLGISQHTHLEQLRRNVYLQRKFEIEKLECSYRQAVNERKLNSHLVSTYNNLCADLSALIRQRRSPLNAIPPNPISPTGIFDLDIDADIWEDIGLNDVVPEPPDWLADEDTCAAIRLLLEIDRCNEEESRVKVERCALQEWAMHEWDGLQRARAHANHVSDDGDDWESDIGCGDEELMDVLEDIALMDQYRGQEVHDIEGDYVIHESLIDSPTKCVRFNL